MPAVRNSGHGTRSCRSSASSWSSGRDLRVPDSDGEPEKKHQPAYTDNTDMQLHEAIAKGLTTVPRSRSTHSRRSSTASRASDSDADDSDNEHQPAPKKKARKVFAARQKKAELERPVVRPAPAVRQKIPLTASAYEDVYRNHMHTLSDTRTFSPKALHLVLHRLCNLWM